MISFSVLKKVQKSMNQVLVKKHKLLSIQCWIIEKKSIAI
jgi:hypothetical protein